MVRDWGKVKNCCQFSCLKFSCLKKKTVAHEVNSLIDVVSFIIPLRNLSSTLEKKPFDKSQ